ncbi:hypothetical protein P5673_005678 [Acropora cervicornis]|uniref:BEN domain-containing protein n=1 Tax=Acropora cervicornis TaxID=6130 RepID=A0AAD9QYE9_ACRCE|nr:hypothetical protein P5673_005678 [Acropora cervicornis]
MYALISWTSRNGVTLEREEVEVRAARTLTVMNGGKMEPDATVNLQYRKDIWGGKIQSLHDSKNDAERHLEREVDDGSESPVVDICETSTNNAQRKRKKKSFGKDFEESTDPEDDIGESESMCHWEEISSGVWCCPIKVKAAVKDAATRTALACALLGIFYPKEELKGRRLHDLDQDVVEAITDFCMVAKLTKEPPLKRTKEGDAPKPSSPMSRSTIKQAMRMKCNTIISLQRKKAETSNAS